MTVCACGCGLNIEPNYRGRFAMFRRGHYDPEKRRTGRQPFLCNGYVMLYAPNHPRAPVEGYIPEHVLIAEKALGRPLKDDEQVHHFNEVRSDNRNENLVICPGAAYHQLLHKRMRALKACGDPNWLKCHICKVWDHPSNLYIHPKATMHRACHAAYQLKRKPR